MYSRYPERSRLSSAALSQSIRSIHCAERIADRKSNRFAVRDLANDCSGSRSPTPARQWCARCAVSLLPTRTAGVQWRLLRRHWFVKEASCGSSARAHSPIAECGRRDGTAAGQTANRNEKIPSRVSAAWAKSTAQTAPARRSGALLAAYRSNRPVEKRRPRSLSVPRRSRGFSPPGKSLGVSSQVSGSAIHLRMSSRMFETHPPPARTDCGQSLGVALAPSSGLPARVASPSRRFILSSPFAVSAGKFPAPVRPKKSIALAATCKYY